jgi:hypothetical protein
VGPSNPKASSAARQPLPSREALSDGDADFPTWADIDGGMQLQSSTRLPVVLIVRASGSHHATTTNLLTAVRICAASPSRLLGHEHDGLARKPDFGYRITVYGSSSWPTARPCGCASPRWMAHCHIAEHMQSGMMFSFTVARQ